MRMFTWKPILLAALTLAAAAPEAPQGQRFPGFYSRLALPLQPVFTGYDPVPGQAFSYRFDGSGGMSRGEFIFASSANALLFSLAAVNAFVPRWLPKGAPQRWGLNGQGRTGPPAGEGW